MTQTRINIRTAVNSSKIRREKRDGRDVIIVPSATLPDGVIMNGVRYPAEEIEKSFASLERTPAPLGHPKLNGKFVSASDPEGMVRGFIGAWNENVRRENGRVHLDKVIDVEYASKSEGGKRVLDAINKGKPIHTSTGLLAVLQPLENDADAEHAATDILFDHDAILLDEDGAATPEQGVGIFVNSGVAKEIPVINSTFTDEADRDIDWAIESLTRAVAKKEQAPLLERIKASILALLKGESVEATPTVNTENQPMAVTDDQIKELEAQVTGLKEELANALKPLTEKLDAIANAEKAKVDAELAEFRAVIVNANLLDEATAATLSIEAARALANQAQPKPAYGLHNGVSQQAKADYDLPA